MKRNTRTSAAVQNPRLTGVSGTLLALGVLVVLAVLVYWNSLSGEFVFDDQQIILQNSQLLNIHSLNDVLNFGFGWRQLLFLTYGMNYYWSGLQPQSYHVVNLVLHVINVVVIYFIILEVAAGEDLRRFAAFAGAAVFAVHTLLSSAVSYIAGRSSVLCGLFYFLAVLLFLKALNDEERPSTRAVYLVLTAFSGLLAWQAKQEVLPLPGVLAALLWLRSGKRDLRYVAVLAALPLLMVVTMREQLKSLFASVMGNKILVNAGFEAVLSPGLYFRTYVTSIIGYYFPRFIYPAGLSADPYVLPVLNWYSPEFVVSVLVLCVLIWLVIRPGKGDKLLTAGLAAILFSPLTAYALIPLADVVLEHRAYIPGLGIALLAACLFRWLARKSETAGVIAMVVAVLVLSVMTIQRNVVFANNVTLWQDAVQKGPEKPRAHFNLGAAYQNAQRPADAIREYQAALALKPDIHAAYSNLAALQIDNGQLDEGEKTLEKLVQIAPEYTEGFVNLSVLYLRQKKTDQAIVAADRAIEINSQSFAAYYNKAEALTQKGDFKAALENYKEANHLRPDLTSFELNLGAAFDRAGDRASAEQVFRKLTNGPMAAEAYRNLGSLYSEMNEYDKAVESLKKAVEVRPNYPDAHHDLGIIYLKRQMTDPAIDEFRTTLKQQPDNGPGVLNLALAYQNKGDLPSARQVLESYLSQFGNSNSTYLQQIRDRAAMLRQR